MFKTSSSRVFTARSVGVLLFSAAMSVVLAGCDLSKNELKLDRSGDMETQDYRDALAPRLPEVKNHIDDASIPDLKPYMATPDGNQKPMPLVSVSLNQNVPLRDALYEAAEQAGYDLELDSKIRGAVIFSAKNKPFDQVVARICEIAGLRYRFDGDSVRIEVDTPYQQVYKINYLNYVRTNTSSIANDISVVSGEGADTGSKFKAEAKSEADFWKELENSLNQITGEASKPATLATSQSPRITAAATDAAAPVEPVLLKADGEMAAGGAPAPAAAAPAGSAGGAPAAVLKVEPLADDAGDADASAGEAGASSAHFSLNKQAGIVSVYGDERVQKQVASYLDLLRKSVTSQVLIEAKVLEVSLKDEFAVGIDWGALNNTLLNGKLNIGVDTIGTTIAPPFSPESNPALGLSFAYTSGDLSATAQAMQRFGTVKALASPRLTVLNNQSAVLSVATNQIYFEIQSSTSQFDSSSSTTRESTIKSVPEGVLINVQPSIDTDAETIAMAVRPSITRIVSYVQDPVESANQVPVVNVQEFDSVIQMNNGQAIVMGGLIQDRANSTQNAVPVLGELPVLGGLFRNQGDSISKTELVVLMKATIVEGGNSVHDTDKDLYRTFSGDRRPFEL